MALLWVERLRVYIRTKCTKISRSSLDRFSRGFQRLVYRTYPAKVIHTTQLLFRQVNPFCPICILSSWDRSESDLFKSLSHFEQVHSAPLSAVQGSGVPGRLLYTDILSQRHLQSATRHHLTVPRCRLSTFGRRTFSVADPMVWNSLPDSLRDPALSSNSFRQSLKTNLFRRYHSAHTAQ